jgi:colanic acid/amylovoran biosynthesis glycosyltransferase
MRVGYLINQYPAFTHTFIRREIRSLEGLGVVIRRYAIRQPEHQPIDPEDNLELQSTHYILPIGIFGLTRDVLKAVLHPIRLARMLAVTLKIGVYSDRGLLRHIAYLFEAIVFSQACMRDNIQHVHVHFGTNAAVVAMLSSRLSHVPFSFTAHGPEEFERAGPLSLAEKIREAAFVVCVSSFGKSQAMRWSRIDDWPKIKLVRCGLDNSFFVPHPGLSISPRFVCVGRICIEKGQLILLDALVHLRERGIYCEVILVGDGPMRQEVEAGILRLSLGGQVIVTGWQAADGVRAQLCRARALVLASISENLPVVIMEALALGMPVISTYVAGIPELVKPHENGWLVPAGDSGALADAMQESLSAPVERLTAMGNAGKHLVLEKHNVLREAKKLQALFAESIKRSTNINIGQPF